jgi:hypothetical protein
MRRQLTSQFLESVKPPEAGRLEIADTGCRGLVFRMTAAGVGSWSFRYRNSVGKQTRATIGEFPTIGLKAARTAADAMRATVAAGGDPVETKRAARSGAETKTFKALSDRYLAEHAERRKRSHKQDAPIWSSTFCRGGTLGPMQGSSAPM